MTNDSISYVVIEVRNEKEETDVVTLLISKTKTIFTRTDDILEFALGKKSNKERLRIRKALEANDESRESTSVVSTPPLQTPMVDGSHMVKVEDVSLNNILDMTIENSEPALKRQRYDEPSTSYAEETNIDWMSLQMEIDAATTKPIEDNYNIHTVCQVCQTNVTSSTVSSLHRMNHAISHTNIYRCICPIEHCNFRTKYTTSLKNHMNRKHDLNPPKIDEQITPQQEEELRQMTDKCFPHYANSIPIQQQHDFMFNIG